MKKKNYNKPSTSTAEQRRNKIYAIILACAMIFWTIASLLGTFAFARTLVGSAETATVRETEQAKSVRLDHRYQEVDLHTSGITWAYDEVHSKDPCYTLFDASIRFYEDGIELVLEGDYYQEYDGNPYSFSVGAEFLEYNIVQTEIIPQLQMENAYITYEPSYFFEQPYGGSYRGSYVRRVNCTADVVYMENTLFKVTYVYEFVWYDIDGVLLGSDFLYLSTEDYYTYGAYVEIVYPYTSTYEVATTSKVVDCGSWFTNYADYFANGYDVGSLDGFDVGFSAGEVAGYDKGVKDAGDYTFFTLISAVVDAPIQAFTGLFNFDLLGVNLADFFFGLLSVCTIIAIVRLFL